MKFPHKSRPTPRMPVCREKAGTLGPRANNAASVPAGPRPHAHMLTRTQSGEARWFFHAGTGCPSDAVPGAVPPHEVTLSQGREKHTVPTVTFDYSVD